MKTLFKKVTATYSELCIQSQTIAIRYSSPLLLVFGVILLTAGLAETSTAATNTSFSKANYNDDLVQNAVGNLFCLIEGAFGALIMVVAGLGAIVAAAMGAYRAAVGMLVVAVGAFILRALVSLFFGTSFSARGGDEGTGPCAV